MAMLYPEEFWVLYGLGANVYDAIGRKMKHVMACDLETGEVIMWSQGTYSPLDWIRWRLRRAGLRWDWLYSGTVHTRHGFWPAPFRVTKSEVRS